MSEAAHPDFEAMLRRALAPVDPPEDLAERMEATLQSLTDLSLDELEAWELGAMRDPRNWPHLARPVAAVAVGATAGTALVLLRVRAQHKKRKAASRHPGDLAQRTARAVAGEARRLLDRR